MGVRQSLTAVAVILLLIPICGSAVMAQEPAEPNAADVYRQAFEAIKPWSDEVDESIRKMIDDGEYSPDAAVDNVLTSNAKALELAREAVSVKKCAFLKPDEKLSANMDLSHLAKARKLARLLVLHGLSVQKSNAMKALEDYLAVRRLAAGISQDRVLLCKLVTMALNRFPLEQIEHLLQSDARVEVAKTLIAELPALKSAEVGIEDTLDGERVCMENSMAEALNPDSQECANKELTGGLSELTGSKESKEKICKKARETFKALLGERLNRMKSAIKNSDLPALCPPSDEYKKIAAEWTERQKKRIQELVDEYALVKGDPAKEKECVQAAEQFAGEGIGRVLLELLVPALNSAIVNAMRGSFDTNALFFQACLVLRKQDTGSYPDELAALKAVSPLVTDEMLKDPFDGKPVRYAKKGNGYVLYSIGEDGVDDKGEIPFKTDTRKGDIIFSAKN